MTNEMPAPAPVAPAPEPLPRTTRVAAYAIVEDADGRLLLCRMREGQPGAGRWTLPGGGLEFGEAPEAGVLRELTEETGLAGRVAGILGVTNRLLHMRRPTGEQEMHALGICYRVVPIGGSLRDEADNSTDRAAWFTRDELATLPVTHLVTSALAFLAGA